MSVYTVRLEVFEGPLDLLLALIRRAQLDITAVALARVTDQFLTYLARLEAIDAGAIAAFCEEASTLMLIKSRTLLPRPPAAPPDDDADAQALVDRLRAYRQFKRVADGLRRRERAGLRAFVRSAPPPDLPPMLDPGGVSVEDLVLAFDAALAAVPVAAEPEAPAGAIVPPAVRLADRLREIRRLLSARGRVTFREVLIGARRDREFIVVSFLAILELLRRAIIRAAQSELFGEIDLVLCPDAVDALAVEDAGAGSFVDG